jgi:acyl-CoA thioesterase FadM
MTFQYEIFISFHLVDAAGIVFFGHVFSLAHQAFESYLIYQLKLTWKEWFQHERWIVPIRHTEALYFHPLRVGHSCLIQVQIADIKESSFQLAYHFYQDHVKCCSVHTTHVFCDRSTQKKIPIPESIYHLLHDQRSSVKNDS